jgi:hypothetical protein
MQVAVTFIISRNPEAIRGIPYLDIDDEYELDPLFYVDINSIAIH